MRNATTLIGRSAEVARVGQLLDAAAVGNGAFLVIKADPGAGKTRLVQECAEIARSRGFATFVGHATDQEIERTLGAGLDALGLRLDQLVGSVVASRTVFEANAPEAAKFLLADRLLEVVEAHCSNGPVLLILEDLHWADAATLAWVRALNERVSALPLAVIVTTRPAEPGTAGHRTLVGLGSAVLALPSLSAPDSILLAADWLGRPLDAGSTDAVWTADGNPLLVIAVLEAVAAGGSLGRGAVSARLTELDTTSLRALQVAAVLGADVDPELVSAVLGRRPLDIIDQFRAAVAAGFLTEINGPLTFRHELYRQAILATISTVALAVLHGEAAQTLARRGAPALDIAEHYLRGTPDDPQAVGWLQQAASEVVAAAPDSAIRLIDKAIGLTPATPPPALMLLQVRALAGAGRIAEAEALGRSLLPALANTGSEAPLRRELAYTALMRNDRPVCVTEIERCSELLVEPAARARALGETALARVLAFDQSGARPAAERAILAGVEYDDVPAQIAGGVALCLIDLYANRVQRAAARAESLVALADTSGSTEACALQPWFVAALALLENDDLDRLTLIAHQGRQVASTKGAGWAVPAYDAIMAFGALRAGALEDAAAAAEATLGYLTGVDGLGVGVWCHAFLAQVSLHQNEPDKAEQHVHAAERLLAREQSQLGFEQVQLVRARLFVLQSEPESALGALTYAWDHFTSAGVLPPLSVIGPPMVRLACGAGETGRVRAAVTSLEQAALTSGTPSVRVVANLTAAWRDMDPDRALSAATLAAKTLRRPLTATALADAAHLFRDRGRHAEASSVAARAARCWSDLGAESDAMDCARIAPTYRLPKSRPQFGIAALTATERKVMARLAEGLTNAAIATDLCVSRRTVETHVSAAYRKLEVSSRVALARIALQHHISTA